MASPSAYVAKNFQTNNMECWHGCWATRTLLHCWWRCKMVQPLWRAVWQFLIKLNTMWPSNYTSRYSPRGDNNNISTHRGICNVHSRFIHDSPNLERAQMSINWENKLRYSHTMDYYSGGSSSSTISSTTKNSSTTVLIRIPGPVRTLCSMEEQCCTNAMYEVPWF